MSVKAALKIVLMANNVEIAESEDTVLWQQVFASITQGSNQLDVAQSARTPGPTSEGVKSNDFDGDKGASSKGMDGLGKFAAELGVTVEELLQVTNPIYI
jgi:hypothetical protein